MHLGIWLLDQFFRVIVIAMPMVWISMCPCGHEIWKTLSTGAKGKLSPPPPLCLTAIQNIFKGAVLGREILTTVSLSVYCNLLLEIAPRGQLIFFKTPRGSFFPRNRYNSGDDGVTLLICMDVLVKGWSQL